MSLINDGINWVKTDEEGVPVTKVLEELTWAGKPSASAFGKGQAWFRDIGAIGYSDGVTWAVTGEGDLYKTNGIAFNEFLTGTSSLTSSTTGAGATLATSTAYGGRGVTITQNTGENIQSTLTFNCAAPFRLEADTVICWLLHMVDPGGISSFRTEVTTQAKNFAGYLSVASPDTAGAAPVNQGGGQAVMYVLGSLLDTGVTGDGSVRIGSYIDRIRLVVKLTAGTKLTVLGCYANPMNITAIPITFDDGYESSYLEGFTYMQKKGLRGTMAINTHTIETTGRMKLRQMQDVYKAGWDVVNHSHSHRHVSFGYGVTLSTVGPCNQIATAQTASAGVPLTLDGTIADAVFDAPRCIVFKYASSPSASYIYATINGIDENGIERTVTFPQFTNTQCATEYVWTKVNSVVLNKDAGVTVAVGVSLSYDEILTEVLPPKTYLANNGFNRGADIYVAPFGEENILLRRVLADLGYKYLRRTRTNVEYPFLCPTCMAMGAAGDGITSGDSATLIAYANKLVAHRGSGGMYLHSIVEDSATPNSSEARVSDFRLVIDDYAAKQAAGTAIFPTYSEYVRMCGYS